jgi:hypothetical protein
METPRINRLEAAACSDRSESGSPILLNQGFHDLQNRRVFLRYLAMLGAACFAGTNAEAKVKAKAAKPGAPKIVYTKKVREITGKLKISQTRWRWIVAHHSAIKYGNATIYDKAHRERGMENGLAYHFIIGNGIDSGDGEIEIGPRWKRQIKGGHVHRPDINEIGIGICFVGNFEETKPTAKQVAAFNELMDYLRGSVVGKKIKFAVHKEIDPGRTACPGRYFPLSQMHASYGKFTVPKVA